MRILFVSGAPFGGSLRSTRELGERLATRGHAIGVLQRLEGSPRRRRLHKRAVNLATKLGDGLAGRAAATLAGQVSCRPRHIPDDTGLRVWGAILPENALVAVCRDFRPDVVVVASLSYTGWAKVQPALAARGIPSVLYVREETGLGHLARGRGPDLLLANAAALTDEAERLGYRCVTIPSVVTLEPCMVESTRERVLFVNLVKIQGLDIAERLAAARPDVRFAFREWWVLDEPARAALAARVGPNVELLPPTDDPRALYADARLLLAPFRFNGRSRLVLEAQVNGIPVLGSANAAVAESIGEGGVVVPVDAPLEEWVAALGELIDDPVRYEVYCEAARRHAARDEIDPDRIVDRFESVIGELLAGRESRPIEAA